MTSKKLQQARDFEARYMPFIPNSERLPVALAPDEEYDQDGCLSGGATEMPDGRQLLYTGVQRIRRADGLMEEHQTQCVAVGDGVGL